MERPELTRLLSARAGPGRLTFIEAPAGSGKSTTLALWLRATAPGPFAWYSVDESDNDISRFWAYVLAGLAQDADRTDAYDGTPAVDAVGGRSGRLLAAPGTSVLEDVVPALINELSLLSAPLTLVLDDYHLITDPQIHATLGFLIEHLPPALSLMISSRRAPPAAWPASRLRGQNILLEIGAKDLRLTRAEAAQLLTEDIGTSLAAADIDLLYDRTEGWCAGLHLAALSLRGRPNPHGRITEFSGTDRHITDYLMAEVLDRQPPPMRTFLRRTSILDRLCASLGDRVTDSNDAAEHLHQAEHEQLFLIALDNQRLWYRYHPLLRDVLIRGLEQTEPELIPVLHRRAAAWHQDHGLPIDAVRHALAAGDAGTISDLITANYGHVANHGQLATVLGWFDAVGDSAVRADTRLLVARAMTAILAGDPSDAATWIEQVDRTAGADTDAPSHADLDAKTALIRQVHSYSCGDIGQALHWSRQALHTIRQDQAFYGMSLSTAAAVDSRLDNFDVAIDGYRRSLARADATGHHLLAVRAIGGLCKLFLRRGEPDAARDWLDRADNDIRWRILDEHHLTHVRHFAHGWLDLAEGRPDIAEPELSRAYQLVRRASFRLEYIEVLTALARAREQVGRRSNAAELRAAANHILRTCPDPGHLVGPPAQNTTVATQPDVANPHHLTQRELTVLTNLAEGLTNAQIAQRLHLSERTVAGHLRSIYHKIGAHSRSAATRYALDNDLA
ncbi:LuxR C-terminal-related transcriptional regulator [Dactylosporangium sp. NPDC049525]|uniref:helix-turn-helix transcriptional regulator n=1 Tax=Dactylosporangium sp. NPDC049525 TaxID=3154730 RepID=UPI00342890D6